MTITEDMQAAILKGPAGAWTPACDGDGQVRDGALRWRRPDAALHEGDARIS
jgi:hypothetical protein